MGPHGEDFKCWLKTCRAALKIRQKLRHLKDKVNKDKLWDKLKSKLQNNLEDLKRHQELRQGKMTSCDLDDVFDAFVWDRKSVFELFGNMETIVLSNLGYGDDYAEELHI